MLTHKQTITENNETKKVSTWSEQLPTINISCKTK